MFTAVNTRNHAWRRFIFCNQIRSFIQLSYCNYLIINCFRFSEPGRRRSLGRREISGRRAIGFGPEGRMRQIFDAGRIFIAKGRDLC
jgi:hypothetical protein